MNSKLNSLIKKFSFINCKYIRGGTSKGVYIEEEDLSKIAKSEKERESVILRILGSPDPYKLQMNGLGGGISSNSKVVILSKRKIENKTYLNYNFGQVSVTENKIDFSGTCGNLASGLFEYCKYSDKYNDCFEENLVFEKDRFNKVLNVWSENKKNVMAIYGNISYDNKVNYNTDNQIEISGVPGKSDALYVSFIYNKHNLLPSNNPIEKIENINFTLINGANPLIVTDLSDYKVKLKNENIDIFKINYNEVEPIFNSLKKFVSENYKIKLNDGLRVCIVDKSDDLVNDIRAVISAPPGRIHHAMTGTGALNISFCSEVKNSTVNKLLISMYDKKKMLNKSKNSIRIQHPSGYFDCSHEIINEDNKYLAVKGGFLRTARLIMEGKAYF